MTDQPAFDPTGERSKPLLPGPPGIATDSPSGSELPDLDEDLAARLRQLSDARVAAQIQAAKQRATTKAGTRAQFAASRAAGLRSRRAAREARLRLAQRHQEGSQE